jgi:acyl-CoA synthetase (AMP-forming)/AMP-acid ligase II
MGAVVARGYHTFATRPALLEPGRVTTFAELQSRVHKVAHALAGLGARPGDRVVLWMENRPEFVEVEQAVFLAGFVRAALSSRLHPTEVMGIVEDCSAKVVVTTPQLAAGLFAAGREAPPSAIVVTVGDVDVEGALSFEELLASAASTPPDTAHPGPEDLAALLYTSGTTGLPKSAMLRHANWIAMVTGLLAELPPIGDGDVVLHVGPMSHLSGSIGTACYARGAATAMLPTFEAADVFRAVSDLGVTVLPLAPTMLANLVEAAAEDSYDLSSLRAIPYGGSAVAPRLLQRAQSLFGDVLVQVYGLSEALVPLTALSPREHRSVPGEDPPTRLSSAGRPSPFVDIRVVTDDGGEAAPGVAGELLVRGDTVMAGYWERPAETAEVLTPGGWLRTGDLGYRDEDGYLYLVDRKRDVIVTGGFNVYPAEVERVIETLPEVREVVVVGAPDGRWGETVTAVIALKAGRSLTSERVIEVCRERLAGYKKPTSVHFVEGLPKNSAGKLLRREVRTRFWAGRERQIGQ